MMLTCADALENARALLKDIPQATAELDWYNDDTAWSIEIYVSKASSEIHADIINTMVKNGYTLTDLDNNMEKDDTPIFYSAIYWFD